MTGISDWLRCVAVNRAFLLPYKPFALFLQTPVVVRRPAEKAALHA